MRSIPGFLVLVSSLFFAHANADKLPQPNQAKDKETSEAPVADTTRYDGLLVAERNRQKFSVHIGSINYIYNEPAFMSLRGRMNEIGTGFRGNILSRGIPMWYGGDLTIGWGKLDYKGGIKNLVTGVTTPYESESNDLFFDLQGGFGITTLNSAITALELGGGLGIWNLRDKGEGASSYTRNTTYLYLHGDGRFNLKAGSRITFFTGAQVKLQAVGVVQSNLSEVNSSYEDVTNVQSGGWGFKANAGMEINTAVMSPYLEVYYREWHIPKSNEDKFTSNNVTYSVHEPANDTGMFGILIGTRF